MRAGVCVCLSSGGGRLKYGCVEVVIVRFHKSASKQASERAGSRASEREQRRRLLLLQRLQSSRSSNVEAEWEQSGASE